jgi:hypothetical protein
MLIFEKHGRHRLFLLEIKGIDTKGERLSELA